MSLSRVLGQIGLAAGVVLAFVGPAMAQGAAPGLGTGMGTPTGPVVGQRPDLEKPKQAAPPAVPGSRPDAAPVVPAEKQAADMSPNDALFDAINRGDIAAVRDAINRGAELRGRDVLGLTPTELSIDLGRNDITFLLLSMRGSTADDEGAARVARGSRPGGRPFPPSPPLRTASASPGTSPGYGAGPPPRGAIVAAPRGANAPTAQFAAAQPQSRPDTLPTARTASGYQGMITAVAPPRQYAAGSGGTPIPQMGFLGFGSTAR